jgi:2-polyprenyl-6-methoxyphenol hydroxylase-like FAD-dependent oxidoreductase
MEAKMSKSIDVLVIGGGPTGLLAAGELARRGISTRIVEQWPSRQPISKALVVQARTLEVMDMMGLADEFTRRGYPAPGLNIGLGGKDPVSVEMHNLPTRYPYLLVITQGETEQILETHLNAQGVALEREVKFEGLEQQDGYVTARLRHASGNIETAQARYVLGCDGAHSAVRTALGLEFEGKDYEAVVFLADVKLDTDFSRSRITNFTSGRGFVSILPFMGEYARIFAVDFTKQDRPESDPLSLEDLQDTVNAVAPTRVMLLEPRWITRFRSPSRQATSNRVQNVFLAGDAAHAHSPAGGQGMNTGLQDAFNLAWTIAAVCREECPPVLLDSYNAERHPVAAHAQQQVDRMFRSFLIRNPLQKLVRDLVLRMVLPIAPVQKRLSEDLSGIGIRYHPTTAAAGAPRQAPFGVAAGARAPDVCFWRAGQADVRLFELLQDRRGLLLSYLDAEHIAPERARVAALTQSISAAFGQLLHIVVLAEGLPKELRNPGPVLVDFRGEFQRAYGVRNASTLLIRRDGYVGFHVAGWDLSLLRSALGPWAQARPAKRGVAPSRFATAVDTVWLANSQ